jgi:Xaa-Pro aminopeptidase
MQPCTSTAASCRTCLTKFVIPPVIADEILTRLRSVKTPDEIASIRAACAVACSAFVDGSKKLREGLTEIEAANLFRQGLTGPPGTREAHRVDGFAYCMSGPNAAEAYAAYQLSRSRQLARGDFALIHGNSYLDGYWTDITRTFCIGAADEHHRSIYEAIFAARLAALDTIRPGIKAAVVDTAARDVLKSRGFDQEFKHGLGHGAGFAAIDHNALPRLHPKSIDVLEVGMVFNVEPGIYIENKCGIRHCDMVALTDKGAEVLTLFQSTPDELVT